MKEAAYPLNRRRLERLDRSFRIAISLQRNRDSFNSTPRKRALELRKVNIVHRRGYRA